ncbi:hypothetical protein C7957_14313 [Halanaerobium saccharolyticum]|uniref:Lj965 prophage protein n=1 Tax=Halanaerobium saccharolyticum TaxID=43595 RepID=A0A4V3CVU9_9FIRM|nr:hypothetical protein [Halanaerobium saccharolyticum]TDP83888.1 hypothetical protein C7957_14313 [Halanaerobium saccharolyticum]
MISQAEADKLINILKEISDTGEYKFPKVGNHNPINLISNDEEYEFIIDVNRKSRIKSDKCTYQKRYRNDIILFRLDINGPKHTNPDGEILDCPHLHIYKEGFKDTWAYPPPENLDLEKNNLSDTNYLIDILIKFLEHCKVVNIDEIKIRGRLF